MMAAFGSCFANATALGMSFVFTCVVWFVADAFGVVVTVFDVTTAELEEFPEVWAVLLETFVGSSTCDWGAPEPLVCEDGFWEVPPPADVLTPFPVLAVSLPPELGDGSDGVAAPALTSC